MYIRLNQLLKTAAVFALLVVPFASRAGGRQGASSQATLEGFGFAVETGPSRDAVRVYLAGYDRLACVNTKTWKVLWSEKTPYGSIDAGPVMSGSTVLYAGGGGAFTIYGVNAKTGHPLWHKDHRSYLMATAPDELFIGEVPGMGVLAITPRTGRKIWDFSRVGPGSINRALYYDGRLYTDSYILNAGDGKLVKELPSGARALAAAGGRVFLANLNSRLEAMDATSERVLWSARTPSAMRPIAVAANRNYVFAMFYEGEPLIARCGVLKAYSAAKGGQVWERKFVSRIQGLGEAPIGADRQFVYVAEPNATLHGSRISALNDQTGKVVWSYQTKTIAFGPPVLTRKVLYVALGKRSLLAIDKGTGRLLRTVPFPDGWRRR